MMVSVNREGQEFGPYSLEEVNRHLAEGSLLSTDLAWHDGLPEWIIITEVEGVIFSGNVEFYEKSNVDGENTSKSISLSEKRKREHHIKNSRVLAYICLSIPLLFLTLYLIALSSGEPLPPMSMGDIIGTVICWLPVLYIGYMGIAHWKSSKIQELKFLDPESAIPKSPASTNQINFFRKDSLTPSMSSNSKLYEIFKKKKNELVGFLSKNFEKYPKSWIALFILGFMGFACWHIWENPYPVLPRNDRKPTKSVEDLEKELRVIQEKAGFKICRKCYEKVDLRASRCPHCTSEIE